MIELNGNNIVDIAVCAIDARHETLPHSTNGQGAWTIGGIAAAALPIDIIAYVVDDCAGGFVNQSYPLTIAMDGAQYQLAAPEAPLAAIILAEIYDRSGQRRVRISNEGYAFGIDAYARVRGRTNAEFPGRTQVHGRGPDRWNGDNPVPDHGDRSSNPDASGTGSGIIVAPGLVITNAHVIEGCSTYRTGRGKHLLDVIAVDEVHDLALLQGPPVGTPIGLRVEAPLWLGEAILAAGFPLMDVLGADLKVTTGNVSGLTGAGGDVSRFQFTAPIGSGSSGGAIVDEQGNLVGVTAASLAHRNFHERGAVSENVNFGIRAVMVGEMIAAAGLLAPNTSIAKGSARRDVVHRLRASVISILVTN